MISVADGAYYIRPGLVDDTLLEGLQLGPDIQQALVAQFAKPDYMDGVNKVVVDEASLIAHRSSDGSQLSSPQPAFRSATISHLPETVFVRLARDATNLTQRMQILESVDFGMCCERVAGTPMKPRVRILVGVVVHVGETVNSGHYYSFVKHRNTQWFVLLRGDINVR